jgi:thiamine kinase-like enzyme
LPSVIEHGDVGHPNLFRLRSGGIGVIDWELAQPNGVPLLDLWFFLSYVASAHSSSENPKDIFRQAFEGPEAWTKPHVERYVREMEIPQEAISPLFVLTWTRYLSELARRLQSEGDEAPHGRRDETSRNQLTNWLRNNRYHAYWRHAVLESG